MFSLVSIGLNDDGVNEVLNFAEADARAVYEIFVGAEGPVSTTKARRLIGNNATLQEVFAAFDTIRTHTSDYLIFYFAGHGDAHGLALLDGETLTFRQLIKELRMTSIPNIMVILDSCQSAGFYAYTHRGEIRLGGTIDTGWLSALANATPGTRLMFSVGATRNAGENVALGHGVFTAALLDALKNAAALLSVKDENFIDDLSVFQHTRYHIREVQRRIQVPESSGLTGDFPMFRPERENTQIGAGYISSVRHARQNDAIVYSFRIIERRAVPTTFVCDVFSPSGTLIHREATKIVPRSDSKGYDYEIVFSPDWLRYDAEARRAYAWNKLFNSGPVRLILLAAILDSADELLDSHTVSWLI